MIWIQFFYLFLCFIKHFQHTTRREIFCSIIIILSKYFLYNFEYNNIIIIINILADNTTFHEIGLDASGHRNVSLDKTARFTCSYLHYNITTSNTNNIVKFRLEFEEF